MALEILVLRRNEGIFYAIGDGRNRHEDALFLSKIGQELAVAGIKAGYDRRLVILKLTIFNMKVRTKA